MEEKTSVHHKLDPTTPFLSEALASSLSHWRHMLLSVIVLADRLRSEEVIAMALLNESRAASTVHSTLLRFKVGQDAGNSACRMNC